jgi:hypothetical protein
MIVVEGPDGAGKTTLVKQLVEDFGLSLAPRVVSAQAERMVDLKEWTEENLRLGWQARVFDRFNLISDPIYRACLPTKTWDEQMYATGWWYDAITRFYALKPIIIYCLPPIETAVFNVQHGVDDNSVVQEEIMSIYYSYVARSAIDMAHRNAYYFDYTRMKARDMYPSLQSTIDQRMYR